MMSDSPDPLADAIESPRSITVQLPPQLVAAIDAASHERKSMRRPTNEELALQLRAAGWEVTPPPEPPTRDDHSLAARRMAQWDGGEGRDESLIGWYESMARELRLVSLDDAEKVETQYRETSPNNIGWFRGRYDDSTHQRLVIYMPAEPIGDDT